MIFVAFIFCRVVPELLGKLFTRGCVDDVACLSEMIAASVPIPMSPAIVKGGAFDGERWWLNDLLTMEGTRLRLDAFRGCGT